MRKFLTVILIIIGLLWIIGALAGSKSKPSFFPRQETAQLPQYSLISASDESYANSIRKIYRVRVKRALSRDELAAISKEIINEATSRQHINAITIFFYLPDSDPRGIYTAGEATWAPGGDWGQLDTTILPKLVLKTGSALGNISLPQKDIVPLPLEEKKHIFLQIVQYQDQGIGDEKAYAVAAKKFGITVDQAKNIGLEGAVKSWPMP